MNILQTRTKTFQLIDAYSRSGVLLDPEGTKQKDYFLKMPSLIDTAQKKIAQVKKIIKSKRVSNVNPVNKLATPLYQFDIVQNNGTDQIYQVTGTAKAYYFEVDDVATIKIEEQTAVGVWTTLETLNNLLADAGSFTAFKGVITPSSALNDIRIRFVAGTLYNHRNRALWEESFSDATRIPNYQQYVPVSLGAEFYKLNKVIFKGQNTNSQSYDLTADFYWEDRNTILVPWYAVGEYKFEYYAMPVTIDSTTADTFELEVPVDAQEAIPYYVAAMLLINENNVVGDRLMNEFNTMVANLDTQIANGSTSVKNTLFMTNGGVDKLF